MKKASLALRKTIKIVSAIVIAGYIFHSFSMPSKQDIFFKKHQVDYFNSRYKNNPKFKRSVDKYLKNIFNKIKVIPKI